MLRAGHAQDAVRIVFLSLQRPLTSPVIIYPPAIQVLLLKEGFICSFLFGKGAEHL